MLNDDNDNDNNDDDDNNKIPKKNIWKPCA